MNYTFSLPVWGDFHVLAYLKYALPSHARNKLKGKYIIHTNMAHVLRGKVEYELPECQVEYRDIDPSRSYFQFSDYYQECFDESEACLFLAADVVMLPSTFAKVQESVKAGNKLVMTAGINCVGDDPPIDNTLPTWARDHLIPTLRGNIWGRNHHNMMGPQTMYFEDGNNFWCQTFHHHPLCIVNDGRGVHFRETTIDWIVPSFFKPEETDVLSGQDGLMVEISPPAKFDQHQRYEIVNATEMAFALKDKIMDSHIHLFERPIAITGTPTDKFKKLTTDCVRLLNTRQLKAVRGDLWQK